jgi:hypothetical protein
MDAVYPNLAGGLRLVAVLRNTLVHNFAPDRGKSTRVRVPFVAQDDIAIEVQLT